MQRMEKAGVSIRLEAVEQCWRKLASNFDAYYAIPISRQSTSNFPGRKSMRAWNLTWVKSRLSNRPSIEIGDFRTEGSVRCGLGDYQQRPRYNCTFIPGVDHQIENITPSNQFRHPFYSC